MDGMHVLIFVEFTKDFKRCSMIVKKISKELFDHGHEVTVLDTEAFDYLSIHDQYEECDKNNNGNYYKRRLALPEQIAADACVATCDAVLFISPKNIPVLPKCMSQLLKSQKSVVLSRWYLLGVSCFLIARQIRKASMAQFIWKMLRKFETYGLHNALGPWRCYERENMNCAKETALPSV